MVAVAQLSESYADTFREEHLVKAERGLLSIPAGSEQGVHALQDMLANSIAFENHAQPDSGDLNQSLRSIETISSKMSDLFLDDVGEALTEIDIVATDTDHSYRPTPFLDQGMLSFYMHSDDSQQEDVMVAMPELIDDEEFVLVPTVGLTLH